MRSCPLRVRIPFNLCTKKQAPTKVDALFYMACLEGFEPPTLWFVAKYSIQLSYKHISKRIDYDNIFFGKMQALFCKK